MARYRCFMAVLLLSGPLSAGSDLTVDAVTRATTLNPSVGDLAVLTDGKTPDQDPNAAAFSWSSMGLLAVEWPAPVQVAAIRVYLGEMQRYAVYGYVGGRFTDTGQRVEVETPVFSKEGLVPLDAVGWYEIRLPADKVVDNLGIQLVGTTVLYEIQFLGPGGTAILDASFGIIKRAFAE